MDHFIALTVKAADASDGLPKLWYKVALENLPAGITATFSVGENTSRMKKETRGDKIALVIPLTRNLTDNEVEDVIGELNLVFDKDFSVTSSRIEVGVKDEVEVEVDYGPLLTLCTAWAKEQHDEWMKDKIDSGWRYGPAVSMANKTHPLLRTWADLPDLYRKVDTSQAEEFLKLMNDHGYVLIAKTELDQLLKESDLR